MATDKKFSVFGVSKLNGEYKVRFANDVMRIKVLAKHGHEDITLVELDPMTKYEGIRSIATMDEFSSAACQAAIAEYLEDKAPKVKATAAPAKAPAKAKAKPAKVEATAAVTEDEDAPF